MTASYQPLLRELAAVERLQILAGDSTASPALRREYRLRYAAATDRYAETPHGADWHDTAEEAARRLLDFDREQGTSRGPTTCQDPRWDGVPRAYVHQEHSLAAQEGRFTTDIDEWMLSVDLGWDDGGWIPTGVAGLQVQRLSSSDVAAEALGGWVGLRTREGTRATLLMTVLDVAAGRGADASTRPITPQVAGSILSALDEKP